MHEKQTTAAIIVHQIALLFGITEYNFVSSKEPLLDPTILKSHEPTQLKLLHIPKEQKNMWVLCIFKGINKIVEWRLTYLIHRCLHYAIKMNLWVCINLHSIIADKDTIFLTKAALTSNSNRIERAELIGKPLFPMWASSSVVACRKKYKWAT